MFLEHLLYSTFHISNYTFHPIWRYTSWLNKGLYKLELFTIQFYYKQKKSIWNENVIIINFFLPTGMEISKHSRVCWLVQYVFLSVTMHINE